MAYDPYYDDYYDRPPRPHRPRMSSGGNYLDPAYGGGGGGSGLHRSRSHGHSTQPAVHYHNYIDMAQDNYQRTEQDYPPPPRSPRGRPQNVYYEAPGAYGVPLMAVRSESRSRSRGRSGDRDDRDYYEQKAVDEYKRRKQEEDREREAAIEKFKIDEANRKKREKEEQEEAVRRHEQELEEEKKKKADAVKEWQAEEEKKKKEREEEEEEKREYMRKQLAKFGFQHNQIEAMIDDEKNKKGQTNFSHDGTLIRMPPQPGFGLHRPVFPKLRRMDIAIETLKYYDLPWEYDHNDSDYIIIKQEMSEKETDVLFEHTRRLRSKNLPKLEGKKKDKNDNQYMWVRKRSKSRNRSPSSGREKLAEAVLKQGLK